MTNKVAIIIPARLASTRMPNKPLVDILGKSMIRRVYEKAISANIGDVFVACDGDKIAAEVESFGGNYILTNPDLPSGTDRIFAASKEIDHNYEIIVNLQGDLPNIDPKVIKNAALLAENSDCDIATLASQIEDRSEILNPNVVKIATSFNDERYGNNCAKALYFSRSAIPYAKNDDAKFYHHIGIYAFKRKSLEKFVNLKQSELEIRESLEQLRALENDMNIYVKIVNTHPLSVDTKEDLEKIIKQIKNEQEK